MARPSRLLLTLREVPMHDPFEESLRDLLKASPSGNDREDRDDAACLGRVLKTANRQVGAGDLFSLLGRWSQALLIAVNNGSAHVAPVRRHSSRNAATGSKADKAD